MFAFVMVLILCTHEDIKRNVIFFHARALFFLRAFPFSQKWVFLQGILEPRANGQWISWVKWIDIADFRLSVCLPVFFFLSRLRIALRVRHMQDKYFTIEQLPHPYFLFLLWRQALTDLPRLALTTLGGINQPLTWEPPQPLGRAYTAMPDSQSLDCEELTEGRCSSWRPATHEEPVYREVLRQR